MRARQKPLLGFWQIWNMCFGFLGIQSGFALQNANASRIFQTLGADIDTLPLLWVAAEGIRHFAANSTGSSGRQSLSELFIHRSYKLYCDDRRVPVRFR